MAKHTTPKTLNDNLRLGRLTLPQWVALAAGGLSLWLWGSIAGGVRDPNAHILLTTVPTVLTVAPILAFFRGGIERYPHQLARYALRRAWVYSARGAQWTHTAIQKGMTDAAVTLRQWQAGRQRRA